MAMIADSLDLTWREIMPAAWRTVRSAPATGAQNMAIDGALLAAAGSGSEGVWRTYAWSNPTISFGRHEAARARFSDESIRRAGLDAVRRPTGGRALLHAAEVTYSVAVPIAPTVPWGTVYAAINRVLLDALRALGVNATLVPPRTTPHVKPDGPLCFDEPSEGEIVVEGRKLVGSAVWRERGAYLQHGSILLHNQQELLLHAMRSDNAEPAPVAASLSQLLREPPTWDAVTEALESALRRQTTLVGNGPPRPAPLELDDETLSRHELRYRDPAWLWRR